MQITEQPTETKLTDEQAEYVDSCRTARRNARKATRSGNPAKRAEGASVIRASTTLIRAVYGQAANAAALQEAGVSE